MNNKKLDNKIDVYRFNYQVLNNQNKVVWKVRNILIKSKMYSVQASSYPIKTSYLKKKNNFFQKNNYLMKIFNLIWIYIIQILNQNKFIFIQSIFLSENSILKEDSYNKKTYCLRLLVGFRKKIKKMNLEKDYKELVKRLDLKFIDFLRLNWFNFFVAIPIFIFSLNLKMKKISIFFILFVYFQ